MLGRDLLSPFDYQPVSNNIDDDHKVIFSQIPNELIFDQILCYFEYRWILKTARLVCKLWNDHHKIIKTNQFRITYNGKIEKLTSMNEHSDELHQVTELLVFGANKSNVELEREFVSKLIDLQKLHLSLNYCDISVIKEFVKLQNLKKIHLCNFTHFVEFMKCKSKIESIILAIFYRKSEIGEIGDFDFDNLNWPLEELILNCPLSSKSVISLLKNETMTKNLKKLDIAKSKLDENVMREISQVGKLRELSLIFAKCGDVGAQYISELENLEMLCLSYNSINGSGLSNFRNLTNITKLNLNSNSIDNEGANYLSSVTSLKYLYLGNNNISDEGLTNYYKLSNLLELDLNHNQIGSIGANYLSQISNITCLWLNDNVIGEEGLKNFGNLSKLTWLYMKNNKIGNGFKYLSNLQKIYYLDVANNDISEESVMKYCENKQILLPSIYISNNPKIGNSGFISLLKLSKILLIEAENCGISDEGISVMLEILSNHKSKVSLFLEKNYLTNYSLKEIIESKNIDKIESLTISNINSELDSNYLNLLAKKLDHFECKNETQTKQEKNTRCSIQ